MNRPEFLIIGAQKAGTSSLFALLAQHPQLKLPVQKELHYFDLHYSRGDAWYSNQFPAGARSGEASPYYLFHPYAARRVAEKLPNARLVVLLRDPVLRALSHYQMERRSGLEPARSFEAAIALEPSRLEPEVARLSADETYVSPVHQTYSYLSRGLYAQQIARWLQYFPPEQLAFFESERLFAEPQVTCDAVCDFLRVRRLERVILPCENRGSYAQMAPRTREALTAFFHGPNQALSGLLGWEPSWCRGSSQPRVLTTAECGT